MRLVALGMLMAAMLLSGALLLTVQPMYASSGSMEPAIDEGDLYFVVKGAPISEGDVITFRFDGTNEFVTHRLVRETGTGYYTQGDANPSTDQAAGYPPVSRSNVLGKVLTVHGSPITVSEMGVIVKVVQSYQLPLLVLGGLLITIMAISALTSGSRTLERRVIYANDIVLPMVIGGLLISFLLIFWGAGVHDLTHVVVQGEATRPETIPVDETITRTITLETHTLPFTTLVVETNGVTIIDQSDTASGIELLVSLPPKKTPGAYHASVAVSTYPSTLPHGVIESLHNVHWLVAALGTIAPIYGPVLLIYLALVDGRTPLRLPPNRWLRRIGDI